MAQDQDQIVPPPDDPRYADLWDHGFRPKAGIPRGKVLQPGIYWSDVFEDRIGEFDRWLQAVKGKQLGRDEPEKRPSSWWDAVWQDLTAESAWSLDAVTDYVTKKREEPMYWVKFELSTPAQWWGFGSVSGSNPDALTREDTAQRPPPQDWRDGMRDAAESMAAMWKWVPWVVGGALGVATLVLVLRAAPRRAEV